MLSGAQVYQVARSVANADGDWAEVPLCVREAIVLALARGESSIPALHDAVGASSVPRATLDPLSSLPPVLTEGVVQRSVQTFEDGQWMRDQSVRSFAQLHNTIETLHAAMASQLSPLLRTAMQLHPDVLSRVQDELNLRCRDLIPDGIPLSDDDIVRITHQEYLLDEMATTLRTLRDQSVSFAANFLTDTEKLAMGANPAYLRPDTREAMQRRHSEASKPLVSTLKTSPPKAPTPEKAHKRVSIQEPGPETDSPSRFRKDAYLCELRERYMLRLAQLNQAEEDEAEKAQLQSATSADKKAQHHSTRRNPHRRLPVSSPESTLSRGSSTRSRSSSSSSDYSSESEY